MKSSLTLKTRVALACLVGGFFAYTCLPEKFLLKANWKPAPAVSSFEDEAQLQAWARPEAIMSPPEPPKASHEPSWVTVSRRVKLQENPHLEFRDLSLFERKGSKFRLIANLPFSWQLRYTFFQDDMWLVNEQDYKVRGWKRLVEVRLDRTEPLIVSAIE